MRAILLVLFVAASGAMLLTAPAESDCLVDYAIWDNYALGYLYTPWERSELTIAGNYAYRVQASTGVSYPPPTPAVYVIDISDPTYPQVATTMAYGNQPSGVAVSGNYAYVTDRTGSLRVYDISNLPNPPTPLGSVSLPAPTAPLMQLAVSGSFVYVPDSGAGLQVIDVSDPNTPTIVGSVSAPADRPFLYVIVSGPYAYVSGWSEYGGMLHLTYSGLRIIDISNPTSPSVVGGIDNDGAMKVLAVLGSYLYVADYGGIRIIDVSNPATPSILSTLDTPGGAGDLAFFNNIAYVADGTLLSVFDVSNPTAPRLIGGATGNSWTVEASDSLVYTAGGDSFRIYPIQCPGYVPPPLPVPISASLIRTWGSFGAEPGQFENPASIAIDDNQLIYVSEYNHRIQKFDSTGVFLGMWGTPGSGPGELSNARGIDIGSDGLVYVADQYNDRVCVFTRDGDFVRTLDMDPYYLVEPNGLDCEPSGNLWVTDERGLHHLSSTGEVLGGIFIDPGNDADPTVITADHDTLYVSFCNAGRLDKYAPASSYVPPFTKTSFLGRDLNCPQGSTLDGDGNIWVCDRNHSRVLKYNSRGAWIGTVQLPTNPRAFPTDIAFDSKGDLYVVDESRQNISKYALDPAPPVDVVLSSFQASPQPSGILLEWNTSSETDFAGFHVHRSLQGETGYRQINPRLLAPPSPYSFLDEDVIPGITYFYRLEAIDRSGDRQFFGPISVTATVVARLQQNRPNPFLGNSTIIPFTLPKSGEVTLRILDLSGRQVRLLVNERMSPGARQVLWDGKNDRGETVSAGVYVYDLTAPAFRASRRLVRIR